MTWLRPLKPAPPGPALLAALGLVLLLAACEQVDLFSGTNRWLYDRLAGLAPLTHRAPGPLLIALDDATIRAEGRWPFPRRTWAELLDTIGAAGPSAVGIDLLFLGRDAADPAGDSLLAGVALAQPNVVFAMAFDAVSARVGGPTSPPALAQRTVLLRHGVPTPPGSPWAAEPVAWPESPLLEAAGSLGNVAVAVDPDGVARRIPLFVRWSGRLYAAFALRVAGLARGGARVEAVTEGDHEFRVRWSDGRRESFPFDDNGATRLRFDPAPRKPDAADLRSTWPETISMRDVLAARRAGRLEDLYRRLAGRVVLVGNTAAQSGTADVGALWNDPAAPLVLLHAAAVEALMAGRVLRPLPAAPAAMAAALMALLAAWAVTRWSLRASLVTLAALAGGTLAMITLLYGLAGRMAPGGLALLAVPMSAAMAGLFRRRHDDQIQAQVLHDLERAREIQRALLPAPLADRPDLDLALCFQPTEAIGGDLPDWFELEDGRLVLALGDVSGSGLPAAMRAQELRGLLRGHLGAGRALPELATWLNAQLRASSPSGSFVTLWLAALRPGDRTLTWVNCGHEPALLIRRGTALWLLPTGEALGLFADAEFHQEEATLQPGDLLLLFTDGVIDAGRPPHLYDMERLREVALRAATPTASSATIVREIVADLVRFNGGAAFSDDVCLIALQPRRG